MLTEWGDGTYTEINVTIDENLTTTLAADIGSNLAEVTSLALSLNLQGILGHLVREKTGSILPPTQDKGGISLLCLDDGLLHIMVNRGLNGAHESGTHVDTLSTKSQRSSQALAVGESTRSDERHTEFLACTAEKDEIGDVVFTNVTGTLESVDGEEVHTKLHGRLGVPNGRALVQNDDTGLLQLSDHRSWVVSGGLDDLDSFINDDLRVGSVVGGDHGWEEGQVHAEGVLGHGATSADFFAKVFGGRLGEGSELFQC